MPLTNILASAYAQSFITSQWSVNNGHILNGAVDISFVDDPFQTILSPDPLETRRHTNSYRESHILLAATRKAQGMHSGIPFGI